MTFQPPAECLNDIVEYLGKDIKSLRSCLLVDRFWCTVAIRILWKNIWNIWDIQYNRNQTHVLSSILSTLIAYLLNESKHLLDENGIFIPTPTPKSPLFHYNSFIQTLSFYEMERIVQDVLTLVNQHTSNNEHLILQELLRAFMNQISSLKVLDYHSYSYLRMIKTIRNIPFASFPGAKDYLTDLF